MSKASIRKLFQDTIYTAGTNSARGNTVSTLDDLLPTNLDQSHGFCISRFEAHRGASSDIQTEPTRLDTVEFQQWVRFNEGIMGANLNFPNQESLKAGISETNILELAYPPYS